MLADTDALLDEIDAVLDMESPAVKAMTLGDLMRKGAGMAGQAIGAWETQQGETCALQAAMYAAKAQDLI